MRETLGRLLAALLAGAILLLAAGCSDLPGGELSDPDTGQDTPLDPAAPDPVELRGVWVSYMELNSLLSGRTAEEARAALDGLLDNCVSWHLNAVFFHVRANSDAYYASELFAPSPSAAPLLEEGFDPLAYAVEGAHEQGLQLHAWINPYRVGTDESYKRSDAVFAYAGRYYYIPSSLEVQKLILDGVREIVDRYEVDGVQYDDYFYPSGGVPAEEPSGFREGGVCRFRYEGGGGLETHPGGRSGSRYPGGGASPGGCVFGISPAASLTSNYSVLYADTAKWAAEAGYVDYLCPQLYFGFENSANPFDKALENWTSLQRDPSVQLYIGLALYKAGIADDAYAGEGRAEWSQNSDILQRSAERVRSAGLGMVFSVTVILIPMEPGS